MPAMSSTLFKFTKLPEGITRRVLFTSSPSWDELAAKIESLYDIPKHDVGVSYTDNDGDEVTLSTNDELQDFYEFNAPSRAVPQGADAMKAIRFTVRDLSSARSSASEADKPLPETPRSSIPNFRNTFGASSAFPGTIFETGLDDWQDVQRFSSAPPYVQYSPEPHAFVETVESDVSISRDADKEDTASSVTMSDDGASKGDKGKGKGKAATVEDVMDEDDDDIRSTVSMLASSAPAKPPIHVASHASTEDIFGTAKAAATSTPSINRDATPKPAEPQAAAEVDDPPLPELEDIQNPRAQAGPSLANDVANLLSTFSNVFATHPELSEGIRNIVQNATSGVYWAAHREAVARAAEDVRRSAQGGAQDAQRAAEEAHRAAEEAAGRRVAEALGGVMRAIGQVAGGLAGGASEATNPARDDEPVTSTPVDANRPDGFHRGPSGLHRNGSLPFASWLRPPPPPPPPHLPNLLPPPPSPLFHMFMGQHNPPVPPAPAQPQLQPFFMPPPPPPPPMNIPGAFPGAGTPPLPHPHRGRHWQHHPHRNSWADFDLHSAAMDVDGVGSTKANAPESAAAPREENREASSKAALLAAKQKYKDEKERYRRERAMRREEKERRKNTSGERCADSDSDMSEEDGSDSGIDSSKPAPPKNPAKDDENEFMEIPAPQEPTDDVLLPADEPEEEAQIVSNARGRFPQLEMFPVSPRRHHTFSGRGIGAGRGRGRGGFMHHHHHPHHSYIPPPPPAAPFAGGMFPPPPPPPHARMPNPFMNPGTSRNAENIMRRLSDMGFTLQDYPALAGKVNARAALYQGVDISKDMEDTVVTEILEELLASKADESQAEGSNLRRSNTTSNSVPGAWV